MTRGHLLGYAGLLATLPLMNLSSSNTLSAELLIEDLDGADRTDLPDPPATLPLAYPRLRSENARLGCLR